MLVRSLRKDSGPGLLKIHIKICTNVCRYLNGAYTVGRAKWSYVTSYCKKKKIIISYQFLNEVKRNGRWGMYATDNIFWDSNVDQM